MLSRQDLRLRISLAFFLSSLLLSIAFALLTFVSFEVIRPLYSEHTQGLDFDDFLSRHPTPQVPGTWQTERYAVYTARINDRASLPNYLRGLEPGHHTVDYRNQVHEVEVLEEGGALYLLVYNEAQIEAVEWRITRLLIVVLGAGALFCSLLTLGFGLITSNRIIQPLTRLARRVETLEADGSLEPISGGYGNDEVAELAQAFERYQQRAREFVEREKSFAADASHELRTGLASISATVEVLLTEPLDESTRGRVLRVQRASRHLTRLIEALLLLHRGELASQKHDDVLRPVAELLPEIVDGRRAAAQEADVQMVVEGVPSSEVKVLPEALAMVVGNLLDNGIAHASGSALYVRLRDNMLEIEDEGPGIAAHELPLVVQRSYRGRRSGGHGAGLGLAIVERLCLCFGWQLEIHSEPERGTRVQVVF